MPTTKIFTGCSKHNSNKVMPHHMNCIFCLGRALTNLAAIVGDMNTRLEAMEEKNDD